MSGSVTLSRRGLLGGASALALLAALPAGARAAAAPSAEAVIAAYADIAHAMYDDALISAKSMQAAIAAFLKDPSEDTLSAARAAWVAARVPYQQTEGFRFGNPIVDDWEGKVNAWPLDEGLIDYVDASSYGEESDENPLYTANVIANTRIKIGDEELDVTTITPELLADKLQEAQEVETNVVTGYHAIEFLLWGQDLNGTGPGAGKRPATDYSLTACTGGHCDRRRAFLEAATTLLVSDLDEMVGNWTADGAARKELLASGPDGGLSTILTGLGSLSYGELAGERMKLGLMLHDPEEEHDCFSDNTHNSHYYDEVGMKAIYEGSYTRLDGSKVGGAGLAAYATAKAPDAATRVASAFDATMARMQVMKDTADQGKMAYDQMIGPNNPEGNKIISDVVDALVAQTRAIEGLVNALGLKIEVEGSDSLDNPSSVAQ